MSEYSKEDLSVADSAIEREFLKACRKHPEWREFGTMRMAAVLSEEVGEAVHLANDMDELLDGLEGVNTATLQEGMDRYYEYLEHFKMEVAQVGAVARRILAELTERGRYV